MSSGIHYGYVDSDRTYTLETLAEVLGVKQPRTAGTICEKIGCNVLNLAKGVHLVSGQEFNVKLEKAARCGIDNDN